MRRYLLDTGIAGCYIDRRRGVFERAQSESALGNWIGIAHPVLAELAYRVEGSANRDRNMQRLQTALASTVVTMDGDFSAAPGLTVENWAS